MATKSILKNVVIKDSTSARNLVRALENAKKKRSVEVEFKHRVKDASREDIRKIFGNAQ